MVNYKGKEISKIEKKIGGKNTSEVDGLYVDSDALEAKSKGDAPPKAQYFIKKPNDKKELFTELLAGLILKEFMKQGLVAPEYHASLICASDVIKFESGEYGLVQDAVSFDELFKGIGTAYTDGSDRDPKKEILYGPERYPLLMKNGEYFGLSTALMFSLLLGANSVHSGNVVVLRPPKDSDKKADQLARLDWGDAFRNFIDPDNNKDVLMPKEYQGRWNYKKITKGYFYNYKKITGIFPATAKQAQKLMENLKDKNLSFFNILSAALAQIPADILDDKTQKELGKYLGSKTLTKTTFGEKGDFKEFAYEMAAVFESRIEQISTLKDMPEADPKNLYGSINPSSLKKLIVDSAEKSPLELQAEGKDKDKIIEQAEAEKADLEQRITELSDKVIVQDAAIAKAAKEKADLEQGNTKLLAEGEVKDKVIGQAEAEKAGLAQRIKDLRDEITAKDAAIDKAAKEKADLEQGNTRLLAEGEEKDKIIEQSAKEKAGLEQHITDLRAEVAAKATAIVKAEKEKTDLEQGNTRLLAEGKEKDKIIEQAEADKASLAQRITALEQTIEQTQQALNKEKLTVKNLQEQLSQKTTPVSTDATAEAEIRAAVEAAELQYQGTLLKQNATVQARLRRIEPLIAIVLQVEKCANEEIDTRSKAYSDAKALVSGMRKAISEYTTSQKAEETALEEFKTSSSSLLNEHKSSLENYRGLKHLLGNLLLAIALVGVGYVIAAGINKLATGSYTFFNDTSSRKQAQSLAEEVDKVAPSPDA